MILKVNVLWPVQSGFGTKQDILLVSFFISNKKKTDEVGVRGSRRMMGQQFNRVVQKQK
jgi:hypothetical protein